MTSSARRVKPDSIQQLPAKSHIIPLTDFNYDNLPPDEAQYLRERAAYINARYAMSQRLAAEIGAALLEAKANMPGVFMAWVSTEFDFSIDTAENYMNVARNMPELSAPDQYNLKAIYKLAQPSTPQAARDAAADLAEDGEKIDYETAYILANAPPPVVTRYLSETLTKPQAYQLARALNKKGLAPAVRSAALAHHVSNAAVVEYLSDCWQREQSTMNHIYPSKTFSAIAADNWTLNGLGWSVPIADATQTDVERFKVDRQAMHIDHATEQYDWLKFQAVIVYGKDGQPFLQPLGAKLPDGLEGESVMVQVRVKRHA